MMIIILKRKITPENLFGGGYRASDREIEYMAMSNYKPALGQTTYEIMDKKIRNKLCKLTKKYLEV